MPPRRLRFTGGSTAQIQNRSDVIVAKKTRAQYNAMPPALQAEWKQYEINNILNADINRRDQEGIKDFLKRCEAKENSPGAGPSGLVKSPQTQESPRKKSKKAAEVPVTPEGLAPWDRNGVNAAILTTPSLANSPYKH